MAFASRSMSETERRYAQIEKEALAVMWANEKFSDYILGRRFLIESDHKPLIPILDTKQLDNLPPCVQRFRLRLARYDYIVEHVPAKYLYTADTLSRALVDESSDNSFQKEVVAFVDTVVEQVSTTKQGLEGYRRAQERDLGCQQVLQYCRQGWLGKGCLNTRENSM